MLELAILGLLQEHPMHGYELRKQLRCLLCGHRAEADVRVTAAGGRDQGGRVLVGNP